MLILVIKVVCVFFSGWLIGVFFVNISIVVDCKMLNLIIWDCIVETLNILLVLKVFIVLYTMAASQVS